MIIVGVQMTQVWMSLATIKAREEKGEKIDEHIILSRLYDTIFTI